MMPELDGLHVYEAIFEKHSQLVNKLVYLSVGVLTNRIPSFLDNTKPRWLDKVEARYTIEALTLPS